MAPAWGEAKGTVKVEAEEVMGVKYALMVRQITVIILLVAGFVTLFTGILLYLFPSGPGSGKLTVLSISKRTAKNVHTYAGFITAGAIVVHLAANWNALKYYIKNLL